MSAKQTIGVDTETNGEDIRDGRGYTQGVSIAWNDGRDAIYLPFRHIDSENNYALGRWRPVLQAIIRNHRAVYHNAKFDLVALASLGITAAGTDFACTLLLAHILDENKPFSGYSLDSCARYYLHGDSKKKEPELVSFIKRFGWGAVPTFMMAEYAAYDAVLCLKLYNALRSKLSAEKLMKYWQQKQKFIVLINEMESNGILIDTEKCEFMISLGKVIMDDIVESLEGKVPTKPADIRYLLIERLGLPYINKKRKAGPSTPTFDQGAMAQYEEVLSRSDNPTGKLILAYRGWQKSVSANYEAYLRFLSPDGRLRCNYKLHGTHTGRMSCEMPNLQQIPKNGSKPWNGGMKECFIPQPGYSLIEADYSQLELRLGTAYGKDQSLIDAFAEGRDVFTEMSGELGMSRQETKTFVYSTQYGGGNKRISDVFNVSIARAQEIRNSYFEAYPGFKTATNNAARIAAAKGKVPIWSGRFRHFLNGEKESYKAFNSVIQGGAADIVEGTMLRLSDEGFNSSDCRMLLQVHDSVVFEVKDQVLEQYKAGIKECMERVNGYNNGPDFGVKFNVDVKEWGK